MSAEMQTKVQASPAQNFTPVQTDILQRKSAVCNAPGLVEDSGRDKEKLTLQHSSVNQAGTTTVPPIVHDGLRAPGQSLAAAAAAARTYMEPRFGHDFSKVRVQSTGPRMIQTKLKINEPGDLYEQEADRVTEQVMRMEVPRVQRQPEEAPFQTKPVITPLVQRQTEEEEEEQEVGFLQTKELPGQSPEVTPALSSSIQSLRGDGQPMPESARAYFEPRFGHDFSRVNVYRDSQAAAAARALNARAFTLGQNIVFGTDRYAPETHEGKRLFAHELTHTLQQRSSSFGPTVQCNVIDDVRTKLSYRFLNWVISDAEAMEALALLGSIPAANLAASLTQLEPKYIEHLLDNLPDAAKTGEVYKRIIQALGSKGISSYTENLLSFGFLDWAITDAEVDRVFNTFVNLPVAEQEKFLVSLNSAKRNRLSRLIDNANTGHHALYIRPWIGTLPRGRLGRQQQKILRTIVTKTSNDAMETLKLAAETRFNVTVGRSTINRRTPIEWNPNILRKTYLVLDELPEAHVARNKELERLGQFRDIVRGEFMTAGVYYPDQKELSINIEPSNFRKTIIHETGHAVDTEMDWSNGLEPAKPIRGGWRNYRLVDLKTCAEEMVDDSDGVIKTILSPPQRGDVVNKMVIAMRERSAVKLKGNIHNLAWFAGLVAATKKEVLADRALKALKIGLNEPWFKAKDGGEHLKKHVYQEGSTRNWVRYRHEARDRKVSDYQFKNPNEWFAEAYAFYYLPDPRGRGEKLADKDRNTKTYFDTNVHTRAPSR